jgi:ADP-ribose pyrophosphatase YjhB (NUDIX family)
VPSVSITRIALGVLRSPAGHVWIERAKPPSLGYWALPGGRIEAGESPLEAARREVREETELIVEGGLHLAILEERFEDAAGAPLYVVEVHAVLFADPGGHPAAADGVSATHRGPEPPSPALEPDRRLARLEPASAPHRITARLRADGDDLVILAWD